MNFELISFALCPFVQRSVITLKHKKVPFKLTYIEDLENPPEWFTKISPLGQVPVLKVDDREVIFESAVINELLDELTPPSMHPKDPIQKAKARAWIEYSSSLIGDLYRLMTAENVDDAREIQAELFSGIERLEPVLGEGPCFSGKTLSLADTAYAPFFMRLAIIPTLWDDPNWAEIPKTRAWGEALLRLPEVRDSVVPDFKKRYMDYLRETGSIWAEF